MPCMLCASDNQTEFSAEMMIHFTGLEHLDQAGALLFPKLLVCLDSGFTRFSASDTTLARLIQNTPIGEKPSRP